MKHKNTGFKRIAMANVYSFNGFRSALKTEAALRQECILFVVMAPVAILSNVSMTDKVLLLLTLFIVIIAELFNSAIEAVVDRVGTEMHPLSGKAKDIGSAAVFVSLLALACTWFALLIYPLMGAHG